MEARSTLRKTPGAAEYCGFAESTFEKLRVTGDGPRFIRRGRSVFYALEDLDEWLSSLPRFHSTSETNKAEVPR